ncbi:hypothetical protein [Bacteroides sp.]|uniref:hypothetical protein n=1 Tax=Bacteroides sp. TaxID=29523 RepID=UPI00261296C2|nr:hypothetical protein [Bacteroides sp.]
MSDLKENEMRVVNSVDYIRGLVGKDSVLITLGNILKDTVSARGYLDYGNPEVMNSLIIPGTYNHGASIVGTIGGYGLLLVLKSNDYIVQLDFVTSGKIIYRFSADNGASWTSWKYLTFT